MTPSPLPGWGRWPDTGESGVRIPIGGALVSVITLDIPQDQLHPSLVNVTGMLWHKVQSSQQRLLMVYREVDTYSKLMGADT